jgi:hypothetical protein
VALTSSSPSANSVHGGQGGLVSVGQGVKVLTGGRDACVAEALLDDLKVGAAGEQPGGMRMAEVM